MQIGFHNPEDVLIIIGGTNDTWTLTDTYFNSYQVKEIFRGIDLKELKSTQQKVIYTGIPKRIGARGGDKINRQINKINGRVFNVLWKNKNVSIINNSWIKEEYYRKDAIHLNNLGKETLVEKIVSVLKSCSRNQRKSEICKIV